MKKKKQTAKMQKGKSQQLYSEENSKRKVPYQIAESKAQTHQTNGK